ncbi:MAG: hemin uptake protein HemP [Fuerstiella sp.]|nr:hemin uptake protein HemP [Fuerstiella sp.]
MSDKPKPKGTAVPIDSSTLLQGQRQVLIEHDGEIYRLVVTRNNKLLLQK